MGRIDEPLSTIQGMLANHWLVKMRSLRNYSVGRYDLSECRKTKGIRGLMKRWITVGIIAFTLLFMVLAACGGGASVANASEHSYCLPFLFLKGHSLF